MFYLQKRTKLFRLHETIVKRMKYQKIQLFIPKLKILCNTDIKPILNNARRFDYFFSQSARVQYIISFIFLFFQMGVRKVFSTERRQQRCGRLCCRRCDGCGAIARNETVFAVSERPDDRIVKNVSSNDKMAVLADELVATTNAKISKFIQIIHIKFDDVTVVDNDNGDNDGSAETVKNDVDASAVNDRVIDERVFKDDGRDDNVTSSDVRAGSSKRNVDPVTKNDNIFKTGITDPTLPILSIHADRPFFFYVCSEFAPEITSTLFFECVRDPRC